MKVVLLSSHSSCLLCWECTLNGTLVLGLLVMDYKPLFDHDNIVQINIPQECNFLYVYKGHLAGLSWFSS